MTQLNGGAGLAPGANGRMETDEAGRRFFVTPDGMRIPMGGGGGSVTVPAGTAAATGSRVAMDDGSTVVVGLAPAEVGSAPAPVAAPSGAPHAGGLAPGASGRMETDEAGRRFFVTPDGMRIPMGGGGGSVTVPAGAAAGTGSRVSMDDGSTVVVGLAPAEAQAQTGGIMMAPGAGLGAGAAPVATAGNRLAGVEPGAGPAAPRGLMGGATRISDDDAIELRSEEIQDIIAMVPHWLVRGGTTILCLTALAMLALSWLIRYPDMVDGRLTLTTPSPPVRIVARTAGELQQVMVRDNAVVPAGAALAVLKNPASFADVTALSRRLDAMGQGLASGGDIPVERFDPALALGDVQPAYTDLTRRLGEYAAFGAGSYYREKIASTERQMADHRLLEERLQSQQRILADQMALAQRKHERSQQLARGSLISADDLDKSETEFLQSRYAVRNGESAITSNSVQLTADAQSLLDLRQKLLDEERQQRTELRASYDALRAAIRKWEQDYVLRSPVAGRVSFFDAARRDQFVAAAQPVMAVVPESQAMVGTAFISEARAGKVRVGQRVIVKLDSYPAQEFGTLEGRVQQIALLANQEGDDKEATYLVRVSFPGGLVTTSGRHLAFRQEMRGTGSVVTDDLRLIERIFDQLLYAANRASRG